MTLLALVSGFVVMTAAFCVLIFWLVMEWLAEGHEGRAGR